MLRFKVRMATPEDMFQVVLIKNIAWVKAYKGIMSDAFLLSRTSAQKMKRTIEKWQQTLLTVNRDKIFLVAENEAGEVIGFVFGGENSHEWLETDKELHALYVHPAMHGYGVGKALMRAFAENIYQTGAQTFSVGCLSDNTSMTFYKYMGGEVLSEINNPHFENLFETFFQYRVSDLLSGNPAKK